MIGQLIPNFASFWRKNDVLMQNDQGLKRKKKNPKKVHNSIISCEFCPIFIEIIAYICKKKNCAFKNYQLPEKFIFPVLLMKNF